MDRRTFLAESALCLTAIVIGKTPHEKEEEVIALGDNKFRAFLLQADTLTVNGNIYPKKVLLNAVENFNCLKNSAPKGHRICGQLGMPKGVSPALFTLSHFVYNLFLERDRLKADIELLNTPEGKLLKTVLSVKPYPIVFRTCGIGMLDNDNGSWVVKKFKISSVNAVFKGDS